MRRRKRMLESLDQDIRDHVERETQDNIGRGMAPEEARTAALRKFGNVTRIKEETREVWSVVWLEQLWQDVRLGLRMLRKSPGFTSVAVLTLALGIGANTAILSATYGILLKPLPYPNSSRFIHVWSSPADSPAERGDDSLNDYLQMKAESAIFEHVTAEHWSFATLTGQGIPADIFVGRVPSNFFTTFGVSPLYGRTFLRLEEKPGHNAVVILSYALWRSNFNADPSVVGKTILLDNKPYTVIGIMLSSFHLSPENLWLPSDPSDDLQATPDNHVLTILAVLRTGISLKQAQTLLGMISDRVASESTYEEKHHFRLYAEPALRAGVQRVRGSLLILLGASCFVLLIACANVAGLLLSRGWMRRRELAVRTALGATRMRIFRQMLNECGLLALAGGTLGLLFAIWGIRLLVSIAPADTPRLDQIGVDSRVFLFAAGISIIASIVFGLAPAMKFSRQNASASLNKGNQRTSGADGFRRFHLQKLLVACEMALCFVLLIGAVLLLRSLNNLFDINFGFRADNVLSLRIEFPKFEYRNFSQATATVGQILENVRSVPGVESASVRINPVLENGVGLSGSFGVEGRPGPSSLDDTWMQARYVTSGYFRTLRIPVQEGRAFSSQDDTSAAPIAMVNEAFIRRYLTGTKPVGSHLIDYLYHYPKGPRIVREVVGVAGDVRDRDPSMPPTPTVYIPYSQFPAPGPLNAFLLVRTASEPMKLTKTVQAQIWDVNKDLPIADIRTLAQNISEDVAEPRFRTTLLGSFGILGLLLGVIGVYGLISYAAVLRTHEIGVRLALGAQQLDILRMVLGEGLLLALIGIAIGVAGALALTRFLHSLLFEIKPTDPATFIGVAILLTIVALTACYLPARRAMRVDPMTALRYE